VDLSRKTKGCHIVIARGNRDHIEVSLPSSLMEEEEEENVPYFRSYKSSCHVISYHESLFSTSFVDYVNSILEKCNVKWKSKSHL